MVLIFLLWTRATGWSQVAVTASISRVASQFREDRILIKPKPGTVTAALAGFHERSKITILHTYGGLGNLQVLRLPSDTTVLAFIRKYEESGLVEYAEPDHVVRMAVTPK